MGRERKQQEEGRLVSQVRAGLLLAMFASARGCRGSDSEQRRESGDTITSKVP